MSPPKVHANGRSIVHAGDGLQHVCAPPDVCKTPTPGGPQPVPYVNVGRSSDLSKGSKHSKISSPDAFGHWLASRNFLSDPNEQMSFRGERDWTETVASCHTCQALLYMAMCEGDTRACG